MYSRKHIICIIHGRFLHVYRLITALANQDVGTWSITPTIIEVKKDRLTLAVLQATVAVASYCKQRMYFFFLWTFRTS